jgi:hypothetical protein
MARKKNICFYRGESIEKGIESVCIRYVRSLYAGVKLRLFDRRAKINITRYNFFNLLYINCNKKNCMI